MWRLVLMLLGVCVVASVGMVGAARRLPLRSYWLAHVSAVDGQIYRMWEDGSHSRRLTDTPGRKMQLAAAPDGTQLAFVSNANQQEEIYILDLINGTTRQLLGGVGFLLEPAWSPDGAWIAYYRGDANDTTTIYRVRPDGSDDQPLVAQGIAEFNPAWAPNGDLVYAFRSEIAFTDLAWWRGGVVQVLTTDSSVDISPTVSPDGAWVVFVSDRDGRYTLYKMPLAADAEAQTQPLLDLLGDNFAPRWSPDGEWIAFWNGSHGNFQILRVRPDGSDLQALTERGAFLAPEWLPLRALPWVAWRLLLFGLLTQTFFWVTIKRHFADH